MTEAQNRVVATTVAGLILAVVFLCPWRVESSGELQWSPIYQPPLSYVRTYDAEYGQQGGSRIESENAEIAVGILLLQVLAVGAAGGVLYTVVSAGTNGDETDVDADGPVVGPYGR